MEQGFVTAAAERVAVPSPEVVGPFWLGAEAGSTYPVTVYDGAGRAVASTPCPLTGNLIADVLNAAAAVQQQATQDEEVARVTEGLRQHSAFRAATGGSHAVAQMGRDAIALIFTLVARATIAEEALAKA